MLRASVFSNRQDHASQQVSPMSSDSSSLPRLVFTDLDGTLLDHDSYRWQPAAPWLERLRLSNVMVIPVTSKTRAELMPLRRELGLHDSPFIAENHTLRPFPGS